MRPTSGPGAIAERGADILRAAREELARADAKATTLFATAGVAVGAVLSGVISGQWSPMRLRGDTAQWFWWAGAAAAAVALACLAAAVYPRTRRRGRNSKITAYFGDAARLSHDELAHSLTRATSTRSTVDQLYEISRIVERKYALLKIGFCLMGLGAVLCVLSVLLGILVA